MKFFRYLSSLIFLALTTHCTPLGDEQELVFDAKKLVGQSPEGVASVLGEPDTTYNHMLFGKRYFTQYYDRYGVEVRHLDGKIASIIVNEPYPLDFAPETITKFGIEYVEPTEYDSLAMIMWKNIKGFKVVNFYLRGVEKPDSIEHSYHIFFNMDTTGNQ